MPNVLSKRTKEPLVSVCILTWNRKLDLLKSINFIKQSTYKNIEIIVVDNVSSDGTSDFIQKKSKDIILITRKNNNGVAGWNDAFKTAKGEYLLVLDDDAHPARDTISQVVKAFEENCQMSILCCNILNYQTKESAFTYLNKGQKEPMEVFDFIGCGFAMKRSVPKQIGYFSDKLFMYAHETEYSVRALAKKLHMFLYPNIIVWHRVSPISRTSGRSLYYCTRNFFLIAWMYFPVSFAINVTLSIFIETGILSIKNNLFGTYIKALGDCFANIIWLSQHRQVVTLDVVQKINTHFPFSFSGQYKRIIKMLLRLGL